MTDQNLINEYYKNGYLNLPIVKGEKNENFRNWLNDVNELDLKAAPQFTQSYSETYDLLKNRSIENKTILNFIKEQDLEQKIERITGQKYYLADYVMRKTYSKKKSYMNWHRDSYFDKNGKQVGRFPSLLKVIYYPNFGEGNLKEPCLQVKRGSHHKVYSNYYVDRISAFLGKADTVYSSNDTFILFDTTAYHYAETTQNKNGAFRLILNFSVLDQLKEFKSDPDFKSFLSETLRPNSYKN